MRTKPGLSDVSAVQVRHGQAVDSCAETQAECPVSGVTSYGGVWMKVRESDAQSVDFFFRPVAEGLGGCKPSCSR